MSNETKKEQPKIISIECPTTVIESPVYVESPKRVESSCYISRTILPVRIGTQKIYEERQSSRIEFREKPAKQEKTETLAAEQKRSSDNSHYLSQYDLPIERGYPKTFTSTKRVIIKFVNQNEKQ